MNLRIAVIALCAVVTASAATISATYTYSVTATGDPTSGPLMGNGTGSVLPLGTMTWRDVANVNVVTGAVTGTFTATFVNGTLFGDLFEQADLSAPPTAVPIAQTLVVTGGTGAFLWYNGRLTGGGIANLVSGDPSSNSGAGTLNTTPEPGSLALLPLGLTGLYFFRTRSPSRG
ncbi:MAG: PEP-CTERM sorting domain-containing protein [Bryobacteraceae bacterium]